MIATNYGGFFHATRVNIGSNRTFQKKKWQTRDYGPVSLVPLTRMEMDCEALGRTVASAVLECLRTGELPPGVAIGPRYVRGESF